MGLHESSQKVLACADYYCFAPLGGADSIFAGLGGCTVYLYVVLGWEINKTLSPDRRKEELSYEGLQKNIQVLSSCGADYIQYPGAFCVDKFNLFSSVLY